MRWLPLLLLAACEAPPSLPTADCGGGLVVQRGTGYDCSFAEKWVAYWRGEYELEYGRLDLQDWTIRVVAFDVHGGRGKTYPSAGVVDVAGEYMMALPHELHHVQVGGGILNGHVGWCVGFYPWEKAVTGWDEGEYLGCK